MKFAIRDDDTSFFTDPQKLIDDYGGVWDICPVSLSVVPFHECTRSGAVPREFWSGDRVFPIGENTELVDFLKEMIGKEKISVMLHGYSHKDNPAGYEFDTGKDLCEKVRKGKEYLEALFETEIKVFVPPHNTLSRKGLDAVTKNGLNIVNIPSFRPGKRQFNLKNVGPFLRQKAFRFRYGQKYPYVLKFHDHKEVGYYSLTPHVRLEELKDSFDFCRERGGVFVLAAHYWEFQTVQRYDKGLLLGDVFGRFWEYVSGFNDIDFVSVNRIFEY